MNEPADFDPIAASLRRQFSVPDLDVLEQRVAEAAAELERDAGPTLVEAPANDEPAPRRTGVLAFAAAALLLVILRPWASQAPAPAPPVAHRPSAPAVTASEHAGQQLHQFLQANARLPSGDADCEPPEPIERCAVEGGEPWLAPGGPFAQLGECGGATGSVCEEFGLPADRALLLVEAATGAHSILCIEQTWTDPKPVLPPNSPYQIHRAELGDFILYEVSEHDAPRAIEFLRL